MRVILAGPDQEGLAHAAYPAFATAGVDVEAVASTALQMLDFAQFMPDAALVVDAGLWPTPDEAASALAAIPNPKVIILPQAWTPYQAQFTALPGLLAGFTAPVSWPEVVATVRSHSSPVIPVHAVPAPALQQQMVAAEPVPSALMLASARTRAVRVGFWGTRGGAGTSTAALTAAKLLASTGRRVMLCDATRRGDLHVMLGLEPQQHPLQVGNITVRLGLPDGGDDVDADIVVDGGRQRRDFNAEWVEVSRPLTEERIRRILGLPPAEDRGQPGRKRQTPRLGLVRLEITE